MANRRVGRNVHQRLAPVLNYEEILALEQRGWSLRQIGKKYSCAHTTVMRFMKKEQLERYSPDNGSTEGPQGQETEAQKTDGRNNPSRVYCSNESRTSSRGSRVQTELTEESRVPALDTRPWSWERWIRHFLGWTPFPHQVVDLQDLDQYNNLRENPRQHGKTTRTLEPFILRRCCETVYLVDTDYPIMYISHSQTNSVRMVMAIKYHLLTNPKIIATYGQLVDLERAEGGIRLRMNRQATLNLVTLRDPQLVSLQGLSITAHVRGTQAKVVIVDDPIDVQAKADGGVNLVKATQDFLLWFNTKILPLVKGVVSVIGTRYLFGQDLFEELDKLGVFMRMTRQAVLGPIPSYTLPERLVDTDGRLLPITPDQIQVDGEVELLCPELFATNPAIPFLRGTPSQNILYKHYLMGDRHFQTELQNNPQLLNTEMRMDWFLPASTLPAHPTITKWAIFTDLAAGQSKDADYTAMVLVGMFGRMEFILYDMVVGRWTGLEKQQQLERFMQAKIDELGVTPRVLIETVLNQRDFFQRIRDESWITPVSIEPGKRGEKLDRIRAGLAQEMQLGKVYLWRGCRHQQQLEVEITGFPHRHPDILDAADQALYWLKTAGHQRVPTAVRTPRLGM